MKAYVIMPYGGNDTEKVKEYNRIFRFMIHEAVTAFDPAAEVLRQDHTGEGGHIIRNVINNIADSDLVIADLSDKNWNVAYELGLRHVMRKYGTILICNDKTELPYDINQLNIIIYPYDNWLDHVEEITEQITKSIRKAMQKERSDSPVFDIFSALPASLTEMLSNDNDVEQRRLIQMSEQLDEARKEIERLRGRIESAGLDSDTTNTQKDLRNLFKAAINNRVYNSDDAVAKLRDLADAKNYEEFSDFLARVLQYGYLDQTDCRSIYFICRQVGIPDITRIFLENVVEFYPDNEELRAFLANQYSMDYHNRDKAMSIVNESMGITRRDGKYELSPKVRSTRLLGSFFDVYIHLRKYSELITIGEMLLKAESRDQALIYRNILNASIKIEDFDRAKRCMEMLLKIDPNNDRTYYMQYLLMDAINDHVNAYVALEKCIGTDPEDTEYYFAMAGEIMDEKIARLAADRPPEHIDSRSRERYAAPFIFHAVNLNPNDTAQRALAFFRKNRLFDSEKYLLELLRGNISLDELRPRFYFSIVSFCLQKTGYEE